MKRVFNYCATLFFTSLLLLAGSCNIGNNINSKKTNSFKEKGYFPLQVGNFWKIADQPEIRIDSLVMIKGKKYYLFISDQDTFYYRETKAGKIFLKTQGDNERLRFNLSVKAGTSWVYSPVNASHKRYIELESKTDTVTIGHHKFYNCYRFASYIPGLIDNKTAIWLAPGVGIVQVDDGTGIKKLESAQVDGIKTGF